jgi:hypothetical protein
MKECTNCSGQGGWDIAVPTSADNVMWIDDGECMELGFKQCFWCGGSGKISEEREKKMKALKKKKK